MLMLLILYGHLLAACIALGAIVLSDLRLGARILGYRVVIPPPSRLEARAIGISLAVLWLSGAVLVAVGLLDRPDYLANPKLQAKIVLVVMLTGNAFLLHRVVFSLLERGLPVSGWSGTQRWTVAVLAALSNSQWLYAAFLGIARPWNFSKPLFEVLGWGLLWWALLTLALRFAIMLASRDQPEDRPADWIDSVKGRLSGVGGLGDYRHDFERS